MQKGRLCPSMTELLLVRYREEREMSESMSADMPAAMRVAAGADRFGEQLGLGINTIAFKVTPPNLGDLLILEITCLAKGGPARHLHYEQDEWLYILEGEFQFEVGGERLETSSSKTLHRWGIQTGKPACQLRNHCLH